MWLSRTITSHHFMNFYSQVKLKLTGLCSAVIPRSKSNTTTGTIADVCEELLRIIPSTWGIWNTIKEYTYYELIYYAVFKAIYFQDFLMFMARIRKSALLTPHLPLFLYVKARISIIVKFLNLKFAVWYFWT